MVKPGGINQREEWERIGYPGAVGRAGWQRSANAISALEPGHSWRSRMPPVSLDEIRVVLGLATSPWPAR